MPTNFKQCKKCLLTKPYADMVSRGKNSHLVRSICKICHNKYTKELYESNLETKRKAGRDHYHRNKEEISYRRIKRLYGLTKEEYLALLTEQNFSCAICGVHQQDLTTTLHVDHDHTTGKVRGILCTNCNRGLGHFQDSETNLRKALEYLNCDKI